MMLSEFTLFFAIVLLSGLPNSSGGHHENITSHVDSKSPQLHSNSSSVHLVTNTSTPSHNSSIIKTDTKVQSTITSNLSSTPALVNTPTLTNPRDHGHQTGHKSPKLSTDWAEGGLVSPTKRIHNESHSVSNTSQETSYPVMKPHKNISARKGVTADNYPRVSTNMSTSSTPPPKHSTQPTTPRKLKPMFTMVVGDKFTRESESFIESPTTGKDYVLPIVLMIFAIPAFIFLVKFLYKRGTEFTERQQYHRMYLIDGMYNTR